MIGTEMLPSAFIGVESDVNMTETWKIVSFWVEKKSRSTKISHSA